MRKIALCLVLVEAMASVPARAADETACQEFTMTMLAYVKTNALRRCTGMGPQWSPRPAEHLSWCQKATPAALKERLADSKAFIDVCLKTGIGSTGPAPAAPPAAAPAAPKAPAAPVANAAPAAPADPAIEPAPTDPVPAPQPDSPASSSLPKRTFP